MNATGCNGGVGAGHVKALTLACLILLATTALVRGQETGDEEAFDQINRRGQQQIDQLNEALWQAGKIFVGIGIALLVIVAVKVISPGRLMDGAGERLLARAVRDVDDLLTRIQKEAETTREDSKTEAIDEGVLAGMMEIAEFSQAEQVPSYVLTVNDTMLDNIRVALRKLRRFQEGNAPRYRDYLFSVIKGMKIITEQSVEAGVHSGLAVDIRQYFKDDKRYRDWHKLLGRFARRGKHQELAETFLIFMKTIKEGKPLVVSGQAPALADDTAVGIAAAPEIPAALSEETLPALQQAAAKEAESLKAVVQTGSQQEDGWQFEFVRRQQQMHLRDEAQRMLSVFLSDERKALREITRIRMLPCRAWNHVLYMLGVDSAEQLHKRVDDRLLTIQEILILEKAFLQTFAKRESLQRVYGRGEEAELMMDMHLPEIRRETLTLLRRCHRAQPSHLDRATEALNEEETPQNNQVKKLIEHYVHHRHDPPETGSSVVTP